MSNPKYYHSLDFQRLQADWYQRLEADGFRDLERRNGVTRDLNRLPASTYQHNETTLTPDHATDGEAHLESPAELENLEVFGSPTSVFDLPQAVYWRAIGCTVNALPTNYRGRRLLIIWAETGNIREAARQCNRTLQQARTIIERFRKTHQGPK